MNVVGKVGSLISQGVYSVATPFHPFGGAVDVIVVQQQEGTFRSTPWYVRFGKFQGVLKGAEKIVRISVNGVEADFHMLLDNSGEAYFIRETETDAFVKGSDSLVSVHENGDGIGSDVFRLEHSVSDSGVVQLRDDLVPESRLERTESDCSHRYYDFDEPEGSEYADLDGAHFGEAENSDSEVVLSVDGHILTAPVLSSEEDAENVQLSTPQFHLGPGEGTEFYISKLDSANAIAQSSNCYEKSNNADISRTTLSFNRSSSEDFVRGDIQNDNVFRSCLDLPELSQNERDFDCGVMGPRSEAGDMQASPQDWITDEKDENGGVLLQRIGSRLSLSSSELPIETGSEDMVEEKTSEKHGQGKEVVVSNTASVNFIDSQTSKDEMPVTCAEADGICDDQPGCGAEVSDSVSAIPGDGTQVCTSPFEISLCRNKLHPGMGPSTAAQVFDLHRVSAETYKESSSAIVKNENLVVKIGDKYLTWEKAAPILLGKCVFNIDLTIEPHDTISIELEEKAKGKDDDAVMTTTSSGRKWRIWPIPFRRVKTIGHTSSTASSEAVYGDPEPDIQSIKEETAQVKNLCEAPRKQFVRTNIPTNEQIASLNLIEGQNLVTFSFSSRVLGRQQVDAHIYLWRWNARIVISDVDGTITKSDVLGQFMPLVGRDWTQSGVARLFSAIKENGYQLLFLSARAIVQAYLTRSFLLNLKQDGKALPSGPVVISPDGLFPALYREVIRRAPHEFKIACLEDIKKLFPQDYNPFYAGFGNRDTDELSYRKIGIPKGKIFIINPKGEVATSHRIDVKSYTSLHTLVNDMFPPTSLVEQEDFNSWNYWKLPLEDIE